MQILRKIKKMNLSKNLNSFPQRKNANGSPQHPATYISMRWQPVKAKVHQILHRPPLGRNPCRIIMSPVSIIIIFSKSKTFISVIYWTGVIIKPAVPEQSLFDPLTHLINNFMLLK